MQTKAGRGIVLTIVVVLGEDVLLSVALLGGRHFEGERDAQEGVYRDSTGMKVA